MPRAGAVWVDVLPNMSGFGRQLEREIGEPVAQASAAAGAQGGEGLMAGIKGKALAGAAVVGAAVGAVLVKGIGEAIDKQKATGKLKAQLGLSVQDAKTAGAAAGKLFTGAVTESVDEGAAAVRATMAAGLAPPKATTKQLAEISTKVQDLATLFEIDLGQGANAAGQAVKTGLAKNAAEALDIMYRGFQIMGPRADDLADTFNEYSTIFRSLGLDMKTVTGLFSQGMQAGARDTDVVADALKEFQIRTTDGSKASAEGFKLLGMDAEKATAMFARGGQGAAAGLQTVLDKLRAMKDPVDRNAAAVALFGTKSEDLGQALFALDPSKAVASLGAVSGAAKQAGDDLRGDAGTSFEQFKRRALMVVGDAAAKYAVPRLMQFGRFLNNDVLPKMQSFAGFVDTRVVPVVTGLGDAFMSGKRWVQEYGLWFAPLAVVIGGVALAMSANAIATGITIGVIGAYSIAIRTAAALTRGWTLVQAGFNAVMALNPITLIVIGVIALGVALVVAYRKSETFRNIVNGAWTALKAGWDVVWNGGLKPGFAAFMTGLRAVGDAAVWLWDNALKPIFSAIDTAARILATIITVALVLPVVWAFKTFGAAGLWLWDNALGPVFRAIWAGALWLWDNGIKPVGTNAVAIFKAIGAGGTWLWKNVLVPVFSGIGAAAGWLYSNGIKPLGDNAVAIFKALGAGGMWLWKNVLVPVFDGIGAAAGWLYRNGIKPPIDKAMELAKALGGAFKTGADAVGKAFDSIKDKAKKPVEFVIDAVYNRGIRGVWNEVAEVFGAPTLPEFKGFARGGVLAGQSSYRQGDDQLVPLRRGEGIAVSEAMRDPYERSRLLAVNSAAMHGRSLRPFQQEGFARGGIFDWVKGAASKTVDLAKSGASWLKDGVKASAEAGLNAVVKPLLDKISGSASTYRTMVTGIPEKMISTILGYSGQADTELEKAGVGQGGFKSGLAWARTQHGLPYQWGGNGNPSWDCSGFLSGIESVIRGEKPHRRWATGAFSGSQAPGGWVLNRQSPYMIGITNAGVGHTAGTLNGVNVESRGGDGVVVGARARSYKDGLFTHRYGYAGTYDQGGLLPPGLSAIYNGTKKPEAVLTGGQFNALAGSGDRIGAAVVAGMAQIGAAVESAADRIGGSTAPAGVVPVTSGGQAAAGPGLNGQPLYLVVEDGTVLRAYVSDRVDDALTDVRRSSRRGDKRNR